MAPKPTLLTRDQFREAVFARDRRVCVLCGAPGEDAHHILERRLFPDGGYYLDNGATVCGPCHLRCEQTLVGVEEVRAAAGIRTRILPPDYDPNQAYDKWGNLVLPDGRRMKGELFDDESVQKALRQAGLLDRFTAYVKYPRTPHLPWSAGATADDKILPDLSGFFDADGRPRRVVASRKMDGENASLYRDAYHARSIDGRHHPSRDWIKSFHARIAHDIPEGWRICGENLYAVHSIRYENLPSWFLGFSVWDAGNVCLSWDETLDWFALLGIEPVEVLYDGPFDEAALRALYNEARDRDRHEGYVVRLADAFPYRAFGRSVAKYVRARHVQTDRHWMAGPVRVNGLRAGNEFDHETGGRTR